MFYTTVHLNYVIIWTNSCDTLSRQSIGADSTYGINNCYAGANDHNPRANIHVIKVIMMLLFYKLIMDEQYPSHISISISVSIYIYTHTHIHTHIHIHTYNIQTVGQEQVNIDQFIQMHITIQYPIYIQNPVSWIAGRFFTTEPPGKPLS